MLVSAQSRWVFIALMVYCATLARYGAEWFASRKFDLHPYLETFRRSGRELTIGLLIALAVPALLAANRHRLRLMSWATISFFMFQCAYASRIWSLEENAVSAIESYVVYTLSILTCGWGVSRWIQSPKDLHGPVRAIAGVGLALVIITSIQFPINRNALMWNGRYMGTTGNAQHAGTMIASTLVAVAYLLSSKREPIGMRWFWGALSGFLVALLIWTGSRTGALMAVIGLATLFRTRVRLILPAAVFFGGSAFIASFLFEDATAVATRLTSSMDTRTQSYTALLESFLSSPVLGSGVTPFSENSYLFIAAKFGVVGLWFLAVPFFLAAKEMIALFVNRKQLGEYELIADFLLASFAILVAGAAAEGFLVGNLNFQVFAIYILLSTLQASREFAGHARLPVPVNSPVTSYGNGQAFA